MQEKAGIIYHFTSVASSIQHQADGMHYILPIRVSRGGYWALTCALPRVMGNHHLHQLIHWEPKRHHQLMQIPKDKGSELPACLLLLLSHLLLVVICGQDHMQAMWWRTRRPAGAAAGFGHGVGKPGVPATATSAFWSDALAVCRGEEPGRPTGFIGRGQSGCMLCGSAEALHQVRCGPYLMLLDGC